MQFYRDETNRLRSRMDELRERVEEAQVDAEEQKRRAAHYGAVQRARRLHQPYRFGGSPDDCCAHCNQISGEPIPYPCPTLQALDGEESST